MHIPGLRVVAPTTPYDAKGCLLQSIRENNPVVFVEHRMVHFQKGHVPEEPYLVPFGKARVLATGSDITLVGISHAVVECLRAHALLREQGIHAEVIDPVSLSPLDMATILASVRKTGRLLVVDSAWTFCGSGAEIVAQTAEELQGKRPVRFRRLGFQPVVCPTTKKLERLYYPDAKAIASATYDLVCPGGAPWVPEAVELPELVQFKGPF